MKKLISLVLALALMLTVATAFAATVTITNAGPDKTYEFKKAFDVTYNSDKSAIRYYTTDADFAALVNTSNCLTATEGNSGEWNIGRVDGKTEADIRDFLQTNYASIPGTAVAATSGAATLGDGFYVMKVTDGEKVVKYSTVYVLGENTTVIDKNDSIPGPDKEEEVGGTTYGHGHQGMTDDEHPTASVGDVIDYTVTGTFPMYIFNNTTGISDLVKKLTLTDTISDGLEYVPGSIELKINDADPDADTTVEIPTVTADDDTFTVTFTTINAEGAFQYNSSNTYTLTYQAKITADAIVDNVDNNTVELKYDQGTTTNIDGGSDSTTVYHYDISLTKQDGTSKEMLKGAQFELYTGDDDNKTKLDLVLVPNTSAGETYGTAEATVNNVYRLAEAGETPVTAMITGTTGIIEIKGLEAGPYYFKETAAPLGYNILKDYTEARTITNANVTITVDNNKGTELPSTGGIGTTIFYIVGGILLVGAAIILVSRRKAHE
jgi:fimbrial isopeptide formation D2 family protein/LPXTG-motif cell wall-anchored protein